MHAYLRTYIYTHTNTHTFHRFSACHKIVEHETSHGYVTDKLKPYDRTPIIQYKYGIK
jgi:hypothetical protein